MVFDEYALHQEFKERRVHGEWFEFENQDDALNDFRPHTMLYLISNKENELDKLDLGLTKDSEALEITFAHCINKAHEENKYVEYYRVISELIKTSQKNFYYGLDFTSYVVGYLQAAYLYREHDEINKQLAPDY
ncbi:hypothetical protein BV378_09085 [Nostoc sp. RF31YmG]|nr:hypothetical protein BV378_09085 [Nostoc sp. RF31YmG]